MQKTRQSYRLNGTPAILNDSKYFIDSHERLRERTTAER